MVFSSIPFLYYFLPVVLLVYFAVPTALKNTVLLVFSLAFYAWGEPIYVFLMAVTILVNYVLGICTEKFRGRPLSKVFLALSVIFCLGALGYFKYADFFIENANNVLGTSIPLFGIALPIGISFYTFQIMSYVIDVYRGSAKAQKNIIDLGAYVSLFPQLIAGPIVRYADIEKQLKYRTHSFQKAHDGIVSFVVGLSKKILIANTLGELCTSFAVVGDKSVMFYWLYALSYMIQIYFDFSGYSDMAIGLGKIFGFTFMDNFRYPLASRSITDFWRRWHISLGSWFRDYVYIPLGGNRRGSIRHIFNILVVWFLTGFWHGAEWNFIIWGLYFALLLMAEKFFLSKYLSKSKIIGHIYVLFFVIISFAIFSASSLGGALETVGGMFGIGTSYFVSESFLYALKNFGFVIVLAFVCATPVMSNCKKLIRRKNTLSKVYDILETPVLLILFVVTTAYLADGSFNPFLYFRF